MVAEQSDRFDLPSFRPTPWLRGAHLQTIVPAFWPRPGMPRAEQRLDVAVDSRNAVRVFVHRPAQARHGTLLLVHGMGGSADSGYVRRTALLALERGWAAARMNLRNCGATEHLASTLYNAGQSADVGAVLAALDTAGWPRPFVAAGFSLGGNIVLRYAATAGAGSLADATAGVNPPIDLAACATAIGQPRNRLYHRHYVAGLCRQLRRVAASRSVPWEPPPLSNAWSIREIDERYTAPDAGYASAAAYYEDASAGSRLSGLRRPALILSARDDPFVDGRLFEPLGGLPHLRLLLPAAGGHCGYWQRGRRPFWAAEALLAFFEGVRNPAG